MARNSFKGRLSALQLVEAVRVCVAFRDRFLVECSGSFLCFSKHPRWRVNLFLGESVLADFLQLLEKAPSLDLFFLGALVEALHRVGATS